MMTKQRLGDAADMLNMKFNFDKNVEFLGHKEEAARELYNWCREQERNPTPEPAKTLADYREVAARIWCDPAMSGKVLDVNLAESIAVALMCGIPLRKASSYFVFADGADPKMMDFRTPGEAQEFIDQQISVYGDDVTFKTFIGESIIIAPVRVDEPAPQTASRSPEEDQAVADPAG